MMIGKISVLAMAAAIAAAGVAPDAAAQTTEGDAGFLDLTMPDLSGETVDADGNYVDPAIRNRGECLDHPGRPAWVMVQPKGMEWRRELMTAYARLQITELIVETGECTCDNRFPDWETFRPAMEELLATFEQSTLLDLPSEQRDRFYDVERDMVRSRSKIGFEYGRTCRGTR